MPLIRRERRALSLSFVRLGVAGALSLSTLIMAGPVPALTGFEQLGLPIPRRELPMATTEIVVDGLVEEAAWREALLIPLKWETDPAENAAAPVETECLITHDQDRLYVAFRAHDPEPTKIRARLADRDEVFSDDFVGIILDTFNDERRAFQFFVNPRGVQMDVFLDQVNGNEDPSWDTIWDSAGRITPGGYEVEMAIPFSSLRFPRAAGPQTWGVDTLRFWPRSSRHRLTSVPRDRNNSCHLCQLGKIVGFEDITPGRNLEIVPTVTSARTDERASFPDGGFTAGDEKTEGGLTATWGITPNLILAGTINPDFSQIEADAAQLDINEQFALFFPEKRPFFLEGADFFETPLRAVFSRSVAQPQWGTKLTGKTGKNGFGLFVAQDEVTNLLLPGSQGSDATTLEQENLSAVLRYRRDLGDSSALGVLATSREGEGYENRVLGADGFYRFNASDTLRFQALTSRTRYPDLLAEDFDQPAEKLSDEAYRLGYNHDSRNWEWYAAYEDIGRGFRADLGFMPRVDFTFLLGGVQRIWWGEEGDWFNRISFGGDYDRTSDQSGQLLEEEYEIFFNYRGPKQTSVNGGVGTKQRFFDGVLFDEAFANLFFEIQATSQTRMSVFARIADDIDFDNTRPGDLLRLNPRLRYDLGRRTRIDLEHDYRRLNVDGGRLFTANLSQLRAVYQLNLRTFFRGVLQYTDIDRDPALFEEEVEGR
ncbi:MAG: carbohydrate binding family 9 domain-containing protein, partial [Acidobacteria bacterium]|nr:carbohydrate binding family 9 domain-containing protein [Acidobacteriota bacterium]